MCDGTASARWISLGEGEGPDGYLALPEGRTARGSVVVAGEFFGVTAHLRGICERLAAEGYAALAPDFYWRHAPRGDFGYDEEGRAAGRRQMTALRREEVLADVASARAAVREFGGGGGTAALGFSLGGHIAVLGATAVPFDLVVSYYGGWLLDGGIPLADPEPPVARSSAIAAHTGFLLGFFGADDFVMSLDEWHRVGEHLHAAGVPHEQVTYPGVGHGFFNDERPDTYDEKAATDAWQRTLAALSRHLRHS
ncbi:carboxymethylenebutenolidase [Streptomyces sp. TLI_235]|nr:dienelactone hydrolase family protein [Streptomyces sp. TLI_235]PBC67385.1 carboxymethylenebutenolidase [Streptomyces sp. TLI_235]